MSPPDETMPAEPQKSSPPAPHASSSFDAIKRSGLSAADAAKQVGRVAAADVKEMGGSVVREAGESLEAAKARIGDTLHRTADNIKHAADSIDEDARWASEALSRGARALDSISGYMSGNRMNAMLQDGEGFAKKNPAAYFAASVAAGFIVARLAKTAAARAGGTRSADWDNGLRGKKSAQNGNGHDRAQNDGVQPDVGDGYDFNEQVGGVGP